MLKGAQEPFSQASTRAGVNHHPEACVSHRLTGRQQAPALPVKDRHHAHALLTSWTVRAWNVVGWHPLCF